MIRTKPKSWPSCITEVLESRRLLSVSWIGASSGSWNTAANWSGGNVPSTTSDVVIAKSVQVNLSGSASVNSINISVAGDNLNVTGGTLTVAANSSIGAGSTLTLNSAILSLASATTLTNSGAIAVNSGSQIAGSGAYVATSTGSMTLASGIAASNLLNNPGFESPSIGSSTTTGPSNWGPWGSSYASSTYVHSGAQSLVQSGSNSGVEQTFAVTAGTTYSASVYGLNPTTAPLTGAQGGFLNISFTNSSGGTITTGGEFVTVLSSSTTPGTWVNSTTMLTAPVGAVGAYFGLQVGAYVSGATGTAGGSVYFDDTSFGVAGATPAEVSVVSVNNSGSISLTAKSQLNDGGVYTQNVGGSLTLLSATLGAGVGNNLVQNPGFESPSATTTTTGPDNWGTWGSTYVSTTYNHSGAQSLMQSGTNSGASQSFGVSPGVSYTISVDALDPTNSPLTGDQGGFLNVSFSNASGGGLSSGSQFVTLVNSNSTVGSWVNYTNTFTVPANAVTYNLDLQLGGYTGLNTTATQGGSVYWDDIAFGPTALNSATVTASSVSNSGTITLGGGDTITDAGTFTQTATGLLDSYLGGPAAGNFYGSLTAGGTATFAGTLEATLVNSYSPTINDGFTLISYPNETGNFASYQLPSASGYAFQSGLNPTYLGISAVPASLTATINASSTTTTATDNLVGVNLALWDGYLNTTQTQQMVEAAGLSILRFPGGSGSDDYHFNDQYNYGYSSNTIPEFAQFVSQVNATGIVTVDYGTASPQEAEAELAYLDGSPSDTTTIGTGIEWSDSAKAWQNVNWQTVGYWASLRAASPLKTDDGLNFMRIAHPAAFTNLKYWEMGNEEYGSWEDDQHGIAGPGGVSTGAQHDPATYATFVAAFESFDAHDLLLPAVSTGIDSSSPDGTGDNNWTRNVVTDLNADGYIPGFISDHNYVQQAGSENDSFLLNSTVSSTSSTLGWVVRHTDYESTLTSILGSTKAATVQFLATEYNSNAGTEGKQMTSLVNGLFAADSAGSLLNAGYVGGLVWDLRNGWTTDGNNSSSLYGWRQGGDEGILGAGDYDPPVTGAYIAYPTYFGQQLASKILQTGGLDVSTVSSYSELTIYSVMEPNGHLELMVLNKNPDASLTDQFNLSGFTPSGAAALWQYGEAQDYAQEESTTGAAALANSTMTLGLTGNNFSYTFPAYSMSVIDLTPKLSVATIAVATPSPAVTTAVSLSVLGLENGSDANLLYTWSATGPSAVTYTGSTNGTNAAKTITGNFSVAGQYIFLVTITDPSAQTITSSVQIVLPVLSSQVGSTLTIDLNSVAPINIAASGSSVSVSENSYQILYSGITAINVIGSATNSTLNFNGPLTTPFTFTNGSTTTLNVNSGTMTIAAGSGSTIDSQLFSTINIAASASLVVSSPASQAGRILLNTQYLNIVGTNALLDLNGNDLEVQNANLGVIQAELQQGSAGGTWQGSSGIVSSQAASDTTHLTTLGFIPASGGTFDGTTPPAGAVLVKYTYYGDADLSGKVDGSDYTRIDSGYVTQMTGWYNGDFNNDGVINGTDYTLIDNAFNTQGAALSAIIAKPQAKSAAKIAATAIPTSTSSIATESAFFSTGSQFTLSNLPWIDKVLGDINQ